MSDVFEQAAQTLDLSLRATGDDYRVQDVLSPEHCRIQFTGMFNNKQVVWDVCIRTLRDYANDIQTNKAAQISLKQFIEIEQGEACYRALVVLKLHEIDTAAIGRTIIMIRKYKRLHLGRHEYGEAIIF